jgi:hypothetical protein
MNATSTGCVPASVGVSCEFASVLARECTAASMGLTSGSFAVLPWMPVCCIAVVLEPAFEAAALVGLAEAVGIGGGFLLGLAVGVNVLTRLVLDKLDLGAGENGR